jgi:hypothetical protein|tara:strand:+ start:10650 stop:10892 length:243 start_codon:yes stop_codon:yes gene_type:complete
MEKEKGIGGRTVSCATAASPPRLRMKLSGVGVSSKVSHNLLKRCCQTNANQPQFFSDLNLLGCAKATPLGKSGGAVQLEI